HVNKADGQRRGQCPSDNGVPGGRPEQFDGAPDAGMDQTVDLRDGNRQVRNAKEFFTEAEERNQQRDLCWVHEIVDRLDSGEIEPQHQPEDGAKRGRQAKSREDTESRAEADAKRNLLRCNALFKQVDDGTQDAAMEEVFAHAAFCWKRAETVSSLFSPNS